ncbi:MAG TPA: hypothetical protein DCM67_05495 [Propionibacteriaceae bacterium]|nr:hypothetical protein [Propionibacteriaceae bacterium]
MSSPLGSARAAANIVAICALGATAGSGVMVVGAGREALVAGYGTTLLMLAWLTAAVSVTFAGMQIPAGWLVDRWGPRRVAYLGAFGSLIFYTTAMAAPSLELALVVRILAGVTMALGFVSGSVLVRSLGMPAWVQGLFGGVALGSGGVAFLVLPALGTTPLGWRSPWLFVVVIAAIAVLALLSVPATAPQPKAPGGVTQPTILSARLFALAGAHTATFGLGVVLSNWLAVQLIRDGGIEVGWADLISALLLIVTAVSRPLGGYLFDRTHDLRVVIVAPLLAGAVTLVALSLPWGVAWALVIAIAFGVFSGMPFAPSFESARRLVPHAPGLAIGIVNGLANAVILAGAPLYIVMIEAGQGSLALWLMAGLWALAAAAVVVTKDRH